MLIIEANYDARTKRKGLLSYLGILPHLHLPMLFPNTLVFIHSGYGAEHQRLGNLETTEAYFLMYDTGLLH